MATGFKDGAVDLSSLFMAYVSGTKVAFTKYTDGATDLREIFQPIEGGTPRANTGFKVGATDLSQLFRDINDPLPPSYTVTLSGQTVTHNTFPGDTAIAAIRFNSDGTVDQGIDNLFSQIDNATDWIIPNGDADSTFDVRATSVSGTWTSSPIADGSWINLGTSRTWTLSRSAVGYGEVSATFQIRKDGGATIDSAVYTLQAQIE